MHKVMSWFKANRNTTNSSYLPATTSVETQSLTYRRSSSSSSLSYRSVQTSRASLSSKKEPENKLEILINLGFTKETAENLLKHYLIEQIMEAVNIFNQNDDYKERYLNNPD